MPPISEVPIFELTSASEKALAWLENLRGSSFVGTESRMESIFQQMDELLRESSPDVESRVKSLRERKTAIQLEINRAESTGEINTLEDWQIHERFQRLIEESRSLFSEVRQVEENFREVARTIVEQQSGYNHTKGRIVGGVLDSHDSLRDSPQGKSFSGSSDFCWIPSAASDSKIRLPGSNDFRTLMRLRAITLCFCVCCPPFASSRRRSVSPPSAWIQVSVERWKLPLSPNGTVFVKSLARSSNPPFVPANWHLREAIFTKSKNFLVFGSECPGHFGNRLSNSNPLFRWLRIFQKSIPKLSAKCSSSPNFPSKS